MDWMVLKNPWSLAEANAENDRLVLQLIAKIPSIPSILVLHSRLTGAFAFTPCRDTRARTP